MMFQWSWRDSNPRPNKKPKCFLHAYLFIGFCDWPGKEQPNQTLASLFSPGHRSANQASLTFTMPLCQARLNIAL